MLGSNVCQRLANVLKTFAKVLAPMARHQNQAPPRLKESKALRKLCLDLLIVAQFFDYDQQSIDHGVASDMNGVSGNTFAQQVVA